MPRFWTTSLAISLVGRTLAQSAVVSNACSTAVFVSPTGAAYAPLDPGAIATLPYDGQGMFRINTDGQDSQRYLEFDFTSGNGGIYYNTAHGEDSASPIDTWGFNPSDPSCASSHCMAIMGPCACNYDGVPGNGDEDYACFCGESPASVTLTLCIPYP